jgi:hypothetical protein
MSATGASLHLAARILGPVDREQHPHDDRDTERYHRPREPLPRASSLERQRGSIAAHCAPRGKARAKRRFAPSDDEAVKITNAAGGCDDFLCDRA